MPLPFHPIYYLAHAGDYRLARFPDSIQGAAKWVAKLRLLKMDQNQLLLQGHAGLQFQRGLGGNEYMKAGGGGISVIYFAFQVWKVSSLTNPLTKLAKSRAKNVLR